MVEFAFLSCIDGLADLLHQGKVSHSINWSYWARIEVSAFITCDLIFFVSDPLFSLELDDENLNSSTKQKWKPSASKQQCQEAYEFVIIVIIRDKSNLVLPLFFGILAGPCLR